MIVEQIVDIPADRRITLEVPKTVPVGKNILTFKPATEESIKVPVFGCAKGKYRMADDFDAPLEDFKDYM